MRKRGELSMQYVIVGALLLIVFVVMLVIFSDQISSLSKSLFGIGNEAKTTAGGDNCEIAFSERKCFKETPQSSGDYVWVTVQNKPQYGWQDCCKEFLGSGYSVDACKSASNINCYEKVKK